MIQFYFLSIFFNAIAGFILISDMKEENGAEAGTGFSINNQTVRLVFGILCLITGICKLLSTTEGDVPILGDLFPALMGIIAGFILIYGFYRSHSTLEHDETGRLNVIFIQHKRVFGFLTLFAALLQFLFPRVPLL